MSASNPAAFFVLLLIALSLIITMRRFSELQKFFALGARQKIAYALKAASFASAVLALAGISWGTRPVLREQSGLAVSFVFDISYSMTAADALEKTPGALTRLEAARLFAKELLRRLDSGVPVSVAVAKGEGMIAVPLTYDRAQAESFLDALSPSLMSQPGSSIGKGIAAAAASFPDHFAYKRALVVFTDGDETDSMMREAALGAARNGVWVYFAGFGSKAQTEITAGDGVTRVTTLLKKDAITRIVEEAANLTEKKFAGIPVGGALFFEAAARSSASRLLQALKANAEERMMAEIQDVPRRGLFLALSIAFLVLSVLFSQLQLPPWKFKRNSPLEKPHTENLPRGKKRIFALLAAVLCFFACSPQTGGVLGILNGAVRWRQQNYQKAAAIFLQSYEAAQKNQNDALAQYALYGLAVTYLSQGDTVPALDAFGELSENSLEQIQFASFYNAGIIASNSGDYNQAAVFFKQALTVDSSSIDAKINLEIAQSLHEASVREAAREVLPASESRQAQSTASTRVFSFLKEMEAEQWKNSQNSGQDDSSVIDY